MSREIGDAVLDVVRTIRQHVPLASQGTERPRWPRACLCPIRRECYSRLLEDRDALDQAELGRPGFDEMTSAIRRAHRLISADPSVADGYLGHLFEGLLSTPLYVWLEIRPLEGRRPASAPDDVVTRSMASFARTTGPLPSFAHVELFPIDDALLDNLQDATKALFTTVSSSEEWVPAGEAVKSDQVQVSSDTLEPDEKESTIPPERRTRPLGISEAARLMGYKGKKAGDRLRRAMDAGAVRFIRLTRQSYVFDRTEFLPESQAKLTPTGPK